MKHISVVIAALEAYREALQRLVILTRGAARDLGAAVRIADPEHQNISNRWGATRHRSPADRIAIADDDQGGAAWRPAARQVDGRLHARLQLGTSDLECVLERQAIEHVEHNAHIEGTDHDWLGLGVKRHHADPGLLHVEPLHNRSQQVARA